MYHTTSLQGNIESSGINLTQRPTLRQNLQNKKEQLESQLLDVNSAIESLDANPELGKALETLVRVNIGCY